MLAVTNCLEAQARGSCLQQCVGGLLVCVDISPCFPCFGAVKHEGEILCFIYSVLPLFVLGFIPPLIQGQHHPTFHLPSSEREIYQLLIVFGVSFDAVVLFF